MAAKDQVPYQAPTKGAFARAVNSRRFELGLTQEEAADLIGVRQQTIHRWEAGATGPQRRVWPPVQEFLGISREQLLNLIEPGRSAEVVELRPGTAAGGAEVERERWRRDLEDRLVAAAVADYEANGEFNDAVRAAFGFLGLLPSPTTPGAR